MSTWINYVKQLLSYYLGTQDDKYILTENGLQLWIVDHEWSPFQKFISGWTSQTKN